MHPEYCSKREPLLVLSLDGQNNVRALSPREKWNKTFTKSTRTLKYGHSHARAQCITINRYKQKPHVPTWADRISPRPVWTGWGESDLYCSTSSPSAVPHPIVHQSSNSTHFWGFLQNTVYFPRWKFLISILLHCSLKQERKLIQKQ